MCSNNDHFSEFVNPKKKQRDLVAGQMYILTIGWNTMTIVSPLLISQNKNERFFSMKIRSSLVTKLHTPPTCNAPRSKPPLSCLGSFAAWLGRVRPLWAGKVRARTPTGTCIRQLIKMTSKKMEIVSGHAVLKEAATRRRSLKL